MPILAINGINVGPYIAALGESKGGRRNIGEELKAVDGSNHVTRLTRKNDLAFKTPPLSLSDAAALEALIIGEGEVWNFDSSLYGSKGTPPSANTGCTATAGSAKFGAGKLIVPATTGTISFPFANLFGDSSKWCIYVWRSTDSGATWSRFVVTSDGRKWLNGVRADGTSTTWLTVSSGVATIANTSGSAVWYDDLVVMPFSPLDAWPSQFQQTAWPPLPYLDVTGDIVREQTSRRMTGQAEELLVKASSVKASLTVELTAR